MEKVQLYEQPECHIVDFEAQSVLCASGEFNNSNPFFGLGEEEW